METPGTFFLKKCWFWKSKKLPGASIHYHSNVWRKSQNSFPIVWLNIFRLFSALNKFEWHHHYHTKEGFKIHSFYFKHGWNLFAFYILNLINIELDFFSSVLFRGLEGKVGTYLFKTFQDFTPKLFRILIQIFSEFYSQTF